MRNFRLGSTSNKISNLSIPQASKNTETRPSRICKNCQSTFDSEPKYNAHIEKCSKKPKEESTPPGKTCKYCKNTYTTSEKEHFRKYKCYKPYKCEYCPNHYLTKKEKEKQEREKHMRTIIDKMLEKY